MYNSVQPPLSPKEFYILLTLTQGECHGYGIRHAVKQLSHGAVMITDSRIYPLLEKLVNDNYITDAGQLPAGPSSSKRKHYQLSNLGRIRMEEEYARLDFALEVMKAANIGQPEIPPDIQRLLDSVR